MKLATKVMFMQISANVGINKFREKAVSAMVKYYRQIDKRTIEGKPVATYINPDTLSYRYKRKGLEAVNLIKENMDKKINGRTCAAGSNQKSYLKEE